MEAELQEIIEQIKADGIKESEQKQQEILQNAKKKADQIIAQAEKEADRIRTDAQQEAEKREASGKAALRQAARDLLLLVNERIISLFDSVIEKKAAEALTGEQLQSAIIEVIKNWNPQKTGEMDIFIPEEEQKRLTTALQKALAERFTAGLEIKPFPSIKAGFTISHKDGSAYYNFTPQGIAEMLSQLLNPQLGKILQEAAGEM